MADELATRIRKARTDAKLSREALAAALGVSLATVVRLETGRTRQVTASRLVQVANATGQPLAYFLEKVTA